MIMIKEVSRQIFLFLHENICCGYSLEAPCQGASNEYPQHIFSWSNIRKIALPKATANMSRLISALTVYKYVK